MYYVTVRDAGRLGTLVGPFITKGAADAHVDPARKASYDVDPRSHFYAFGTSRIKTPAARKRVGAGKLNSRLGLDTSGAPLDALP